MWRCSERLIGRPGAPVAAPLRRVGCAFRGTSLADVAELEPGIGEEASVTAPKAAEHQRPRRKLMLGAASAAVRALSWAGVVQDTLDDERLIALASADTGLSDYGHPAALRRMSVLLRSLREQADLSALGRYSMHAKMRRHLKARLEFVDMARRQPGTMQVAVRKPTFILGFPRTGTSLLYSLLAQDPQRMAPQLWELLSSEQPVPERGSAQAEQRADKLASALAMNMRFAPEIAAVHPLEARAPEECFYLLENSFLSMSFLLVGHLPAYLDAILADDPQDSLQAYREFKQQIQLLLAREPNRSWLSKSPVHVLHIDALLETFPDARIIETYRAPEQSIPSLCSMFRVSRGLMARQDGSVGVGETCLRLFREGADRMAAARERCAAYARVDYTDLVNDPVGCVRRIYRTLGDDWTPELERGVKTWLSGDRHEKMPRHRYSLQEFGLSLSDIEGLGASDSIRVTRPIGRGREPIRASQPQPRQS